MSSDREKIFSAIRAALDPLPTRTEKPEWEESLVVCKPSGQFDSLKAQFADKLAFASGRFYDSVEPLAEFLKAEQSTFGYCDPALAHLLDGVEGITFDTEYDESKINEYSFGITKGSAGIAESGTIMLKDGDTSARLGALAPWIHIAVIDEADIVPHIPAAIERFGDDPSIIFATGPSKTADVEGILIEGVHGPGIQVALVLS
ncbi:LUD domain-containing protein [Coraliomargarita algicola]|uniref:LUD domain-containing protein n=1 Tax=Coraliomargarita algicola TaxID=3092156 RepID=A0ABZ0RL61_9BACT|nr:LUD domain-containing protein [Coraliomargarita sp. J2-16]WPJ95886.1 LUD domain-containing protein [Coraliomargarita sp. J2-16]